MQYGSVAHRAPRTTKVIRRFVIGILLVANAAVFGGLAYLLALRGTVEGSVETIPVDNLPALEKPVVNPTTESRSLFLLLVGSDSREGLPADFEGAFGDFEGQRADVLMLLHVMPEEGRAQLVSLPRDLKVTGPNGRPEKLNAAFGRSANELIEQVGRITGVSVNHYVEVDFVGFASVVDALGGVDLYFPFPSRDEKSGLNVEAGNIHLDGPTALAYARSRTFQEHRDGQWVNVPGSDIERTGRQQQLIFAILAELKRPTNALGMQRLVESVGDKITTDAGLDFDTLVNLAWDMRSFGADNLEAATLPVDFATIDGISYVVPREPEAGTLLEAFRSGEPLSGLSEHATRIDIRNGNGLAGAAAQAAAALRDLGYAIQSVGNAASSDYETTLIVARADELARGRALALDMGFGSVVAGVVPPGADLIVYLGLDAAGFGAGPAG